MTAEPGVRALLAALAEGDTDEVLPLSGMLAGVGRRAFGMLLLISALPAFIPIPGGGAISGPLTMLVGVQLLTGRRQPWLPRVIARRGPHRGALARFQRHIARPLAWLEKLVRPRLSGIFRHRAATVCSGVLLVMLGVLMALPVPFTNYPLGGLILLFALALLERDGVLMLVAWVSSLVGSVSLGLLSGNLLAQAGRWLDGML
jgi:hypothetical protein